KGTDSRTKPKRQTPPPLSLEQGEAGCPLELIRANRSARDKQHHHHAEAWRWTNVGVMSKSRAAPGPTRANALTIEFSIGIIGSVLAAVNRQPWIEAANPRWTRDCNAETTLNHR